MLGGFRGLMHNEVNYVFYDTAKQAGFKDVVMEPQLQELSGIQVQIGKQGQKSSERAADSWVLVSTATRIFRHHGVFAVRPELQEQEPFKLLHDAREEEEA